MQSRAFLPVSREPFKTLALISVNIPVSTISELHSNSLGMAHSFNPSIAIVDTNERYVSVNAVYAEQFDRSPAEMHGSTIREMVGEDSYHLMKPHLDRAVSSEQSTQSVSEPMADGATTYRQVSYDPQLSADGQVTGVMIVAVDIGGHMMIKSSNK